MRDEGSQDVLRQILMDHNRRYPRWGVEDVYKLLHQAAMGSEHAAPEEALARAWLDRELSQMGPGPAEGVVDPISPDGEVVRVHLRPFVAEGHDPQKLVAAFLRTARDHPASVATLESSCRQAVLVAADGAMPFTAGALRAFLQEVASRRYPPVHHSAMYRASYRPAYRVVSQRALRAEIPLLWDKP